MKNLTKLSDNFMRELVQKAHNDCEEFAKELISVSDANVAKEITSMIEQQEEDYFYRMASFVFLDKCEEQFKDSIKFTEFLIKRAPEDKKATAREIKEQIDSYITIMRMSYYKTFLLGLNTGTGIINKHGIAKYYI